MRIRVLWAFAVFCGSYLPLSVILLAQNYKMPSGVNGYCWRWLYLRSDCPVPFESATFAFSMFLFCLFCFLLTLGVLRLIKPHISVVVISARHKPADLMNYVLPYVVSFMSLEYQEIGKFVGFTIFLGWMFWITYASGQVILNPLLTVFGWKLYEICYKFPGGETEHSGSALAKCDLVAGRSYQQVPLQEVLIIKNHQDGDDGEH